MPTISSGGCVIAEAELSGGKTIVVRVGFGFGVGLVENVGVGLVENVGVGFTIFLPLLQMSFLPDFMQVNTIPFDFDVTPALRHEVPGITFAVAQGALTTIANNKIIRIASRRFIA